MVKQAILGLDKDEQIVVEIKRHPIGLIGIFITTLAVFILSLGAIFIASSFDGNLGLAEYRPVMIVGGIVLAAFIVLFGIIAEYIYSKNELIVTNENIIQILQFSLFNQQVSQLNLAKIQDVTTDQAGVLPTVFNYGTVNIETAGEAANFVFRYAPDPNKIAKMIIEAHENYTDRPGKNTHDSRI